MRITSENKIVIFSNEFHSETISTAISELSRFLYASAGAVCVSESGIRALNKNEIGFAIGLAEENRVSFEDKNDDAFVSFVKNNVVYICGKTDRATLYGVYEFLESIVGVRFLSITATHIPDLREKGIVVPETYEKNESPVFDIRSYWTHDGEVSAEYSARMRVMTLWYDEKSATKFGGGMRDVFYNDGHNVNKLYQEGYFATFGNQPDGTVIYEGGADNDGKPFILRSTTVSDPSNSGSICLSDDKVVNLVTKGVIERIKAHPTCDYFGVMQEDTKFFCSCPKCKAEPSKTNVVIGFCNKIAREVKRWCESEGKSFTGGRKKYIVTYAYGYTEIPPTIPVENNIMVELALIDSANYAYSFVDKENQTDSCFNAIEGWRKIVSDDRILFYSYETNFNNYHWYIANLTNLLPDLQYMTNFGKLIVTFEAGEMFCDCWQALIRTYVCSKLMWNPSKYNQTDVMNMVKEFCDLYYERNGAVVYEYITNMEKAYTEVKRKYGKKSNRPYHVAVADHILLHHNDTEAITDAFGVKHLLTANEPEYFTKEFLLARANDLRKVYNTADGEMKKRLANVLLTADIMYFSQWKYYNDISDDISYTDILHQKEKYPEFAFFATEIKEIVSLIETPSEAIKRSLNPVLGADDYAGMDGSHKFDFWKE